MSTKSFLLLFLLLLTPTISHAQEMVTHVPFSQPDIAKPGMVISLSTRDYYLADTPYDPWAMGIALAPTEGATDSEITVRSAGVVDVLVNLENGEIALGDLITSSSQPGFAMKATKRGPVIGIAQAPFSSSDKSATATIPVALGFFRVDQTKESGGVIGSLKDLTSLTVIASQDSPVDVFKYILSAFILYTSFLISIFTFGRNARNGITALGRNPLARIPITVGIMLNMAITCFLIGAGWWLGYLALRY